MAEPARRTEGTPVYGCGRARVGLQTDRVAATRPGSDRQPVASEFALWENRAISFGASCFPVPVSA